MAKIEVTKTELVWPGKYNEDGAHFDRVVSQIFSRDFTIRRPPERKVCKECDCRLYCSQEGSIALRERNL
jgi:hypothetical protein